MLDHVSVGVTDLARATRFYDAALGALGYGRMLTFDVAASWGEDFPRFWASLPIDGTPASAGAGVHVCFKAKSRADVDAFHKAALAAGGTDDGAPGLRPQYTPTYYGAFVRDPDGNKVEAVCHAPGP